MLLTSKVASEISLETTDEAEAVCRDAVSDHKKIFRKKYHSLDGNSQ